MASRESLKRVCFNCRLLKTEYESSGRSVFRCAKRRDPIPSAFVWKEEICPGFEPESRINPRPEPTGGNDARREKWTPPTCT